MNAVNIEMYSRYANGSRGVSIDNWGCGRNYISISIFNYNNLNFLIVLLNLCKVKFNFHYLNRSTEGWIHFHVRSSFLGIKRIAKQTQKFCTNKYLSCRRLDKLNVTFSFFSLF